MEFWKGEIVWMLTWGQTDVTGRLFVFFFLCVLGQSKFVQQETRFCVRGRYPGVCCYHNNEWLMAIKLTLTQAHSRVHFIYSNLCYSLQDSYCINNERLLSEMKVLCWYVGFRERWNENIERQMSDWTEALEELFVFIFLFGEKCTTAVLFLLPSQRRLCENSRVAFDLFFFTY